MEAQLAVALHESTPAVQLRLQRVRDASNRPQRVVQPPLELFRVGGEVNCSAVDLKTLLAHLLIEGHEVTVQSRRPLLADLVARSHGGGLSLPETRRGFVVELALGPAVADNR